MKAKWDNEKTEINKVQTLREQIEQVNADIEKAQREYDLNKAAELKYGKLPQLQKQLDAEEKAAADKKEASLLRDTVTEEEIARIVARWTGIPVEKLCEGEREKLLHLPTCCTAA
jgi:ATP-dependent Clp protease ATP-binding subunit ClpB